jgi:hypothetical protein
VPFSLAPLFEISPVTLTFFPGFSDNRQRNGNHSSNLVKFLCNFRDSNVASVWFRGPLLEWRGGISARLLFYALAPARPRTSGSQPPRSSNYNYELGIYMSVPTPTTAPPSTASSTKAGAGGGPRVPIGPGPATLCTTEADDGNYTPCQSVGVIAKKTGALARNQTQVAKDLLAPCATRH